MEIGGFSEREFRIAIIMMLTKVRYPCLCKVRISSEQIEDIKKAGIIEMKNAITVLKTQ